MLNPSVYLSSFGWKGEGNGLRQGSASRPLAIPQKRTLAGLGKDRDEAFPFWDHLFAAAAKSIQIKVSGDEVGGTESGLTVQSTLLRTTTGILSNRRPVAGTPVTSGTATSSDVDPTPRLTLLATAKRESARKRLYAAFFRGPVLGPDAEQDAVSTAEVEAQTVKEVHNIDTQFSKQERQGKTKKKRKRKYEDIQGTADEGKNEKKKSKRHHDLDANRDGESKTRTAREVHRDDEQPTAKRKENVTSEKHIETSEEKRKRNAAKAERRKNKEERRKRKQERRKAREKGNDSGTTSHQD